MKNLYQKLKEKGWSNEEISRAGSIITKAETKKTKFVSFLDIFIYWFAFFVSIIGNMVISIALVPFLLAFQGVFLFAVIIILALVFGFLFDFLIRDIEKLQKKHYVIAGIFIPAIAAITIFYMTMFANYVSVKLKIGFLHSPFWITVIYVIAFSAPYMVYRIVNKLPFY